MTAQEPFHILCMGPKRDITDLYSLLMVILRQFLMKVLGRKILALLFGQKSAGIKLVSSHETQMNIRNHSIFSLWVPQGIRWCANRSLQSILVILRQFFMEVARKILAIWSEIS